ncbi:MAG: YegS/Rv2252/BmrU family lipid kinase, partial [Gemmatimonadota bacterium]
LKVAELHWRDIRFIETRAPGEAVARIRAAVEQGVARVLVLGGDGSMHEAANGILTAAVERFPPVGIVPCGTGNDYAKLLGTHGLSPTQAILRLVHGHTAWFDVGHAWDEYFLNSVGIGFDAEVARRVGDQKKLRGTAAYLVGVAQAYAGFRPFDAVVSSGTDSFTDHLLLLEIGIGSTVGGGFRLTPAARPDDGLFDVCAIRRLGPFGFFTRLPLAMLGWHTRLKEVRTFQATSLSIESRNGPLVAQLDGEVRSAGSRMEVRLEPGRLPVMIAGKRPSAQWQSVQA